MSASSTASAHTPKHGVSRRDFLGMALGTLISLPAVAGGYLVPASVAHAAESPKGAEQDGGEALEGTTKITMVSASEVGFVVVDTSNGGRIKVPGATVKVTSRYNKKSVKGTTNEEGEVILDVRNLAENPSYADVDDLESYGFNGTIEMACPGYRNFQTALVRVEGGGGLLVPTRPSTDAAPYPLMVSFNEWDILYTGTPFACTPANDSTHTITMEFAQLGSSQVTVMFKQDKDDITLFTATGTPQNGKLTIEKQGKFLQKGHAEALPITLDKYDSSSDETLDVDYHAFSIELVQGHTHYSWPIHLIVCETEIERDDVRPESGLSPFKTEKGMNTGLDLTWPSSLPVVGGGKISPFMPTLPVNVCLNPWGYLQVTVQLTPDWGYKRDNGEHKGPQKWQQQPRKPAAEQYQDKLNAVESNLDKAIAAYSDGILVHPMKSSWQFVVTFGSQFVALAQWDTVKHQFRGLLALQGFIKANYTHTWPFLLGPIPFVATLTINSLTMLSLQGAMYTKESKTQTPEGVLNDTSEWCFDYSNCGLTLTENFTPSFSFGVGVKGVMSVSAKASFTLIVVTGLVSDKDYSTSKSLPHIVCGFMVQISVVVSFFLFDATFPLYNLKYRDFYDNWKGGLQPMSDDEPLMRALADEDPAEFFNSMNIITDAMLAKHVEFNETAAETTDENGLAPLAAQGEDEGFVDGVFDWESVREDDIKGTLDNGITITYKVYRIVPDDEMEGIVAQSAEADETETHQDAATEGVQALPDADATEEPTIALGAGPLDAQSEPAADEAVAGEDEPAVTEDKPAVTEDEPATEEGSLIPGEEEAEVAGDASTDKALADQASQTAGQPGKDAEKDETAPRARRRGILRRRPSSHSYQPVGSGEGLFAMAEDSVAKLYDPSLDPDPDSAGIGINGGVRPSADRIIAQNVYGDPRMKIANLHTDTNGIHLRATCVFRIGTVLIDGQVRTRIIMTVVDAESSMSDASDIIGSSKPIDFDITDLEGITHDDLYDYDFDIAFTTSGNADSVLLVVVSGKRAMQDNTPITQAASDLVFSYVEFHVYEAFGGRTGYVVRSFASTDPESDEWDGYYHSFTNVRCATDGTDQSPNIIVAYLDTYSEDMDKLLSGGTEDVHTRVVFKLIDRVKGTWKDAEQSDVDRAMGTIENGLVYRMDLSPKIADAYTLTLTTTEERYYYVLKLDNTTGVFASIKQAAMLVDTTPLVPWPQQSCYLTTYPKASYLEEINENGLWKEPDKYDRSQWVLQKAWWEEELDNPSDPDSGTPVLRFEEVGPANFNIDNFGMNNAGSFIFWPQAREPVERRIYNSTGGYETLEDSALYHLMACRVHNGYFSEPFIAADLPHDLSSIQIVASRDNLAPLEVLSTEPVDSGDRDNAGNPIYHSVDIWYTAVPHLRVITATGCIAPVPFVSPGGKLMFHVALRNDGNSYLSGCKLQLCEHAVTKDADGKVTSDVASEVEGYITELTFGKNTLVESHQNPVVNGEFQNIEPDFALAPGKTSVYKAFVRVPKEWTDEKYVSFVAFDPTVAEGGAMAGMSDDVIQYKTFALEPGEAKPAATDGTAHADRDRRYMGLITINEAVAEGDDIYDAPGTTWAEGEERPTPAENTPTDAVTPADGTSANGGTSAVGNPATGSTRATSTPTADTHTVETRTTTPRTGDPLSGTLAAGLALGGAALAAYGRRRAANEHAAKE